MWKQFKKFHILIQLKHEISALCSIPLSVGLEDDILKILSMTTKFWVKL